MQKFKKATDDFVQNIQDRMNKYMVEHNQPERKVVLLSRYKWLEVLVKELGQGSWKVYCYIAMIDFVNKTLGEVKCGDIYRVSKSKPIKHARGNVFNNSTWDCIGPYEISRRDSTPWAVFDN